jgi:membrane-associated phospholipid phosphatase
MNWQLSILQWIQQFKHPTLDSFFTVVTMSAEETFFIIMAAIGLWSFNKHLAQRVGFAFITSTVFNPFLKSVFAIERPIGQEAIESLRVHTAEGYSFPSGHTQGAASFWFGLLWALRKHWVSVIAITMILLVAFSRLYLGVHWPVDVFAGVVFGIFWVLVVHWLFNFAETHNRLSLLWVLVLPFFIPYFLYPENKPLIVSLGSSIGVLSGILIERKFIGYSVSGLWWQHLLKFVLGVIVLIGLKVVLKLVLVFPAQYADLVRYGAIGFWLTAGAPFVFVKLRLVKLDQSFHSAV